MSPTSYQTAPPRTSMVTYRASAVNFRSGFSLAPPPLSSTRDRRYAQMLTDGHYANHERTGLGPPLLRLGGSGKADLRSAPLRRDRSHVPRSNARSGRLEEAGRRGRRPPLGTIGAGFGRQNNH